MQAYEVWVQVLQAITGGGAAGHAEVQAIKLPLDDPTAVEGAGTSRSSGAAAEPGISAVVPDDPVDTESTCSEYVAPPLFAPRLTADAELRGLVIRNVFQKI